LVVRDLSSKI